MGHICERNACYADPWRPYTPILLNAMKDDFEIHNIFKPMNTFQIGMGFGIGIGVPPEDHPASWFALISGAKKWVVHPPSLQKPVQQLNHKCEIKFRDHDALMCTQRTGDILWLPNYWWHETCGLTNYSVGFGGITYRGCCKNKIPKEKCMPHGEEQVVYSLDDIPYCKDHNCIDLEDINT